MINSEHFNISIICPQKSTIFVMFGNKTFREGDIFFFTSLHLEAAFSDNE